MNIKNVRPCKKKAVTAHCKAVTAKKYPSLHTAKPSTEKNSRHAPSISSSECFYLHLLVVLHHDEAFS
jgi:hypothetical protein